MARPNFSVVIGGEYIHPNLTPPKRLVGAVLSSETIEVSSGSRRKPTGWVPPTPYLIRVRRVQWQTGRVTARANYPGAPTTTISGVIGSNYSLGMGGGLFNGDNYFNDCLTENGALSAIPGLRDKALLKVRGALKQSKVNLGVAFVERDKTARLLGDTAISLAKSFNNLKRGRVRAAMRDLGISAKRTAPRGSGVTSKWLELQYGWLPLLSDVHGACEALAGRTRSDWRVTAKARVHDERSFSRYVPSTMSGPGNNTIATSKHSCLARIDAFPSNEVAASFASLGLTNPLLVAWEIVPFSFVVDWAIPIGSWLESLDATLGFSVQGYSSSLKVETIWNSALSERVTEGTGFMDASYAGAKRYFYLSRQTSSDVPQVRFPRLRNPGSLKHMANGLSLLTQAFSRRS